MNEGFGGKYFFDWCAGGVEMAGSIRWGERWTNICISSVSSWCSVGEGMVVGGVGMNLNPIIYQHCSEETPISRQLPIHISSSCLLLQLTTTDCQLPCSPFPAWLTPLSCIWAPILTNQRAAFSHVTCFQPIRAQYYAYDMSSYTWAWLEWWHIGHWQWPHTTRYMGTLSIDDCSPGHNTHDIGHWSPLLIIRINQIVSVLWGEEYSDHLPISYLSLLCHHIICSYHPCVPCLTCQHIFLQWWIYHILYSVRPSVSPSHFWQAGKQKVTDARTDAVTLSNWIE